MFELPEPECKYGYPSYQIDKMFPGERRDDFSRWMRGQTVMLCEGRSYNYDTKEYEPNECADNPHGPVIYKWDVERYVRGLPIID